MQSRRALRPQPHPHSPDLIPGGKPPPGGHSPRCGPGEGDTALAMGWGAKSPLCHCWGWGKPSIAPNPAPSCGSEHPGDIPMSTVGMHPWLWDTHWGYGTPTGLGDTQRESGMPTGPVEHPLGYGYPWCYTMPMGTMGHPHSCGTHWAMGHLWCYMIILMGAMGRP